VVGSADLGLVAHAPDYWRKECLVCGFCGPFVPADLARVAREDRAAEEGKP
jgi:hypothetical protein